MDQIVKIKHDDELVDYSGLPQVEVVVVDTWEPPPHVYFGKKMANGKMEKEPVYVHQSYPKMLYSMVNGRVRAKVVTSKGEHDALDADKFKESPAAFGIVTAPSFDDVAKAKLAQEEKVKEQTPKYVGEFVGVAPRAKAKRGPNKPKKVADPQ